MNETIITGCFLGTRGRRFAELTNSALQVVSPDLATRLKILGRGCWQAETLIPESVYQTLRESVLGESWYERLVREEVDGNLPRLFKGRETQLRNQLYEAVERIKQDPYRIQATVEELESTKLLLAVEEYAIGEYRKLANPRITDTILKFLEKIHPKYGPDLDDAGLPNEWVIKEMLPARQGKEVPGLEKTDYPWISIEGVKLYGIEESEKLENEDFVVLSCGIARKLGGL